MKASWFSSGGDFPAMASSHHIVPARLVCAAGVRYFTRMLSCVAMRRLREVMEHCANIESKEQTSSHSSELVNRVDLKGSMNKTT